MGTEEQPDSSGDNIVRLVAAVMVGGVLWFVTPMSSLEAQLVAMKKVFKVSTWRYLMAQAQYYWVEFWSGSGR
jgi:hypothetical protein